MAHPRNRRHDHDPLAPGLAGTASTSSSSSRHAACRSTASSSGTPGTPTTSTTSARPDGRGLDHRHGPVRDGARADGRPPRADGAGPPPPRLRRPHDPLARRRGLQPRDAAVVAGADGAAVAHGDDPAPDPPDAAGRGRRRTRSSTRCWSSTRGACSSPAAASPVGPGSRQHTEDDGDMKAALLRPTRARSSSTRCPSPNQVPTRCGSRSAAWACAARTSPSSAGRGRRRGTRGSRATRRSARSTRSASGSRRPASARSSWSSRTSPCFDVWRSAAAA